MLPPDRLCTVASQTLSWTNGGLLMPIVEYEPGTPFPGVIGRTAEESSPAWPAPARAQKGAPNVLFIVLDDTGYGNLGCYGSPIETPNFDGIAANGLRYNSMHTTALCSPSRSCIVTGRNHHANSMAAITELATGFPGYNGVMPLENGMLSEILVENGYSTFMVGKWHLTPSNHETAAGPYDRWPLGRGFQRYYGFLGGDTSQWYPDLVYDNHQVEPPKKPEEGYHLSEDLVDKAVSFIADTKQADPDKPFYLHLCFGATHAPHHVAKEWADKYKGVFDDGWDAYREKTFARQKELGIAPADAELSRHDPDVPDWDALPAPERQLYSRMMEVFAGFLSHTDHQVGRLLEFLTNLGELENTLIMVISDNGASAEGGPTGTLNEAQFFNNAEGPVEDSLKLIDEIGGPKHFNHYPWGWTWAGNTPFRRWKRETYRGGSTDPFIVSWPKGIKAKGEVRTQYAHIIDMVPTVLDALGIQPPGEIRGVAQSPMHGVSLAHTFDDSNASSSRETQYFEMLGHRAIYHDGWRAVCAWPGPSFAEAGMGFGQPISSDTLSKLDATGWELYHVAEDFAENRNVAADNRDRLIAMIGTWYVEAGKYGVMPVDGSGLARMVVEKPLVALPRDRYTYKPNTQSVPNFAAPRVLNRPHSITADVEIPEQGAEGVLLSQGTAAGGYSFFMKDGKLRYVHNYVGRKLLGVESEDVVPAGKHELRFEFEPTGKPDMQKGKGSPGKLQLYVDGTLVGDADADVTTPFTFNPGALTCGANPGSPVTPDYVGPFTFSGTLHSVTLDVSGELIQDPEAELRVHLARQ
jgi:arylsulfatase A-like enzyme